MRPSIIGIKGTRIAAVLFFLPLFSFAQRTFEPAFSADAIDFNASRQYVNGKAGPVKPELLKKALGFYPRNANWQDKLWELGTAGEGGDTTFEAMIVLKQAVAVGTVALSYADFDPKKTKGSRHQGEMWYLKPGTTGMPDPKRAATWVKVEFGSAQPFVRFAALPPGAKARAFLYRDVRARGEARIRYWKFYRQRLLNISPMANGYGESLAVDSDPASLTQGGSWHSGDKPQPISPTNPSWYILAWSKPQTVEGLFMFTSAARVRLLQYRGAAGSNPALAPKSAWRELKFKTDWDNKHTFPYWACWHRWLTLPNVKTSAIRIEVLAADQNSKGVWISGLGAFIDLQNQPVPVLTPKDTRPPFRVRYELPRDGEMALVINDARGRRLRNVVAQVPRLKGKAEEAWDLKDGQGKYVKPGTYYLEAIVGPQLQLLYRHTPYPNLRKWHQDRTPWLTSHHGPNGWLSDHSQNWACAAVGDKVYFGSPMAEAGVCLIECDLEGKKHWGKHDFGAWRGVNRLTSDGKTLFIEATDNWLYRMDPATREITKLAPVWRPNRRGWLQAIAAGNGRIYLGFGGLPMFDNAFGGGQIDFDASLPKRPAQAGGGRPAPNPRYDFMRVIRVAGSPPGQYAMQGADKPPSNFPVALDSTFGAKRKQYVVIAFKQPVAIGSLVFPYPLAAKEKIDFSVLKPKAPYPPRPGTDRHWIALPPTKSGNAAWTCLPAPEGVLTRALRIRFTRPGDEMDDVMEEDDEDDGGADIGGLFDKQEKIQIGDRQGWLGRLEGLKILRRRFRDVAPLAKVRVNSGTVHKDGAWDAKRTRALWHDDPGIYIMEWAKPQRLAGLAIKEIDGALTQIDVWQGDGKPSMNGKAHDRKSRAAGWRNVATYRQKRRSAYEPSIERNVHGCYMDGYVDFNEIVTTRAVRLRIVEQWLDNGDKNAECRKHDGRSEHGMHYTQSHTAALDTRWCRMLGVAALEYLGGESRVDTIVYRRLEIRDGNTGKLLKEFRADVGWNGMGVGPNGVLYTIHRNHEQIDRVDTRTGKATPVIQNIEPSKMTVGPDGRFYVHPWTNDCRAGIRVYGKDGKFEQTLGKPGAIKAGEWDPRRIGDVAAMTVDQRGSLWIIESHDNPRRILQYDVKTGKLLKEILGNTHYGGGGWLHRFDKSRAFHGKVEFEINWAKAASRIKRLLPMGGDYAAIRMKGHTYLTSLPSGHHDRQSFAVLYLDDPVKLPRMVAAFGDATLFEPLRTSAIITAMKGRPPKEFGFNWSDRNGNGKVEVGEVTLTRKRQGERWGGLGRFDKRLGCVGANAYYRVKKFLDGGVPIYVREAVKRGGHLRLDNGDIFALHGQVTPDSGVANLVSDNQGKVKWSYPVGAVGVSGLHIPPWTPGHVSNEFGIIGHETAAKGDLGEFVVVHANTGQWKIWTADGLLAGQILLHKTDPRSRFFSALTEARPGMRMDPLTGSQEHFHGFFTKTEPDGKYYAIIGFTEMNIVEVKGINDFRRVKVPVRVTRDDLSKTRNWERDQSRRKTQSRVLLVTAPRLKRTPQIDGHTGGHEWPQPGTPLGDLPVTFRVGFDKDNLYLCWQGEGIGKLANSGTDYRRYFKTGACLDFQIGADPKASGDRSRPVAGDARVLVTFVNDKPQVVLYQPVSKTKEPWRTYTEAGGETTFVRVVRLRNLPVGIVRNRDHTSVEVAIRLSTLGLRIRPNIIYKMDWGVLTSNDGKVVKQRAYWSNKTATGTSDEAVEARLEPNMWGNLRFQVEENIEDLELD